ncbi:hypothetical protein [Woeseia oceani]|uniref:hypothetical protein n=1 Tax=Woeseia oceani TaxID=1548547 RepID=UPI0012EA6F04|nr:hypothetical protein [Woeseia oceani]
MTNIATLKLTTTKQVPCDAAGPVEQRVVALNIDDLHPWLAMRIIYDDQSVSSHCLGLCRLRATMLVSSLS